ncbi:MAG TPA: 30S ribosomal protein S17 [Acidobacteriota bacterium]|jgi:small subunit ribosomal protein S17|nr:30S ribosomal protein S17 [Acidobacteriota bacterium]NLI46386.1 30S ribosomal protein S17 [Acidobacteriota bacterium]HNR38346.1 30S ribosomal protein S17 [Acidobacteriota bacterium]HNU00784.1 30S ribosomal protein S17 [Acidobacteriota bacterium]HOB51529.1 30S ribosomal protein S17 [Acidobacteriota bacterium]
MENQSVTRKNEKIGTVTSNAMQKTVVVSVDRFYQHPAVKKIVRRTSKFMAHDEAGACNVGDKVRIMECRPLSRRKRWRVIEIIEKAK